MEIVAEPGGHNRDIINILLTSRTLVFSPTIYGPRASRLGHKSKGEKLGP